MKLFNSEMLGFWGALLGALISGIFAVMVFALGKHSEDKNEEKELLSFGELYYTSIEVLQDYYVDKQIAFMDTFIYDIKATKYKPHRLKTVDASDYFNRISEINIQDISKLYVLLRRETKSLIIAVNNIDYLKNQLSNYISDANNSVLESIEDTKVIFSIYNGVFSKNKKLPYPSTIQEITQVEKILIENGYDNMMISQIQTYRQKIENRNEALLVTYENVKSKLIEVNDALDVETKILKELIKNK